MDLSILHWIQDTICHPVWIEVFRFITVLGNRGIIWFGFAAILAFRKRGKEALFLVLTLALTALIVDGVLKPVIMRPRPFIHDPVLIPRISPPVSWSFPSDILQHQCAVHSFF